MYRSFSMSRKGARHLKNDIPCQDNSLCEEYKGHYIAMVADGHGSKRHFRSDIGSFLACKVAAEEIKAFIDGEIRMENEPCAETDPFFGIDDVMDCVTDIDWPEDEVIEGDAKCDTDTMLNELKSGIIKSWNEAVFKDFQENPWTEDELKEQKDILTEEQYAELIDGISFNVPYGSTLLAVFTFDSGWAAIQEGDGDFVHIGRDGIYDWPMPESGFNEGHKTASLCMQDPMRDFRHVIGYDDPAGLIVYTDGIEKTFSPAGNEIMSLIHWVLLNEQKEEEKRADNLSRTLDMISEKSRSGDDTSVAGIIDPEAGDIVPAAGMNQKKKNLDKIYARIAEIESTIQYNEQRLSQSKWNISDHISGAVEQLEQIIQKEKNAVDELRKKALELQDGIEKVSAVKENKQDDISKEE